MTHSPDHAERAREVAHRIVLEFRPDSWPAKEDELARLLLNTFADPAAALRGRDRVVEAEEQARECQSVWRCAVGDFTGALDVLKNRWEKSRRKHEREAGATLAGVLDLVWAARDPAAGSYAEAATNGKKLIERVRAALHDAKEEGA